MPSTYFYICQSLLVGLVALWAVIGSLNTLKKKFIKTRAVAYILTKEKTGKLSVRVFLDGCHEICTKWKVLAWKMSLVILPGNKVLEFKDTLPRLTLTDDGDIGMDATLELNEEDINWLNKPESRYCWINITDGIVETNMGQFKLQQDKVSIGLGEL